MPVYIQYYRFGVTGIYVGAGEIRWMDARCIYEALMNVDLRIVAIVHTSAVKNPYPAGFSGFSYLLGFL
ncbi:hypothetical protein ACSBOB_06960 [Mesorhizobium sp. ASY16-5R]|uniref:hypothetical protein n=1 Tax=Mesorhizobium sp. ASY16-5R TaxID=3445772 RepID=UPI003FA11C1A